MTSWSQLIEKIQGLLRAFEEDLANNNDHQLPVDLPSALPSDEVTIAVLSTRPMIQQLNCHDTNTVEPCSKRLKSDSRLTVAADEDIPTSIQKISSQLQPLKSKSDRQLRKKYKYVKNKIILCKETRKSERVLAIVGKKYKYVNKKFIVCEEPGKDERDIEVGKETCKQSTVNVNDPFEYVGTQLTPASDAEVHDGRNCTEQLSLFEETAGDELRQMQQPVTEDKRAVMQKKCRRQQPKPMENGLKQLAEDIADAEMYNLIISQQCLRKSRNDEQTTDTIQFPLNDNITELTGISDDIVTNDVANEMCDNETASDIDICMQDRHSADGDDRRNTGDNETVLVTGKQHCCASDVALSDLDLSIQLNVDTEQLHSGQVASSCASDSTEIYTAEHASQAMLGSIETAAVEACTVKIAASDSDAVTGTLSYAVTDTGVQHHSSCNEVLTVANIPPSSTLQCDVSGGHAKAVAVHNEQSLHSMSCRTDVKSSYKRQCKAQQKKPKNKSAKSELKKMKKKPASAIASDVDDYSSGEFKVFVILFWLNCESVLY